MEKRDYTSPHYPSAALIVIDYQNDCVLPGSVMEIAGSWEVYPELCKLVRSVRKAGLPIIHVVRAYLPDGSNVDLCRRAAVEQGEQLFLPGTPGIEVPDGLKPEGAPAFDWDGLIRGQFQQIGESEWAMYKSRWGAFYQTDLEQFLKSRGVDTLLFAGCNYPNCPRTSIYEAGERDFRIVLVRDALSGTYEKGMQEMANTGVTVTDTETVCARLREIVNNS